MVSLSDVKVLYIDEEVQHMPSAARPSEELATRQATSDDDPRHNPFADSIASSQYPSQYTTESRLPPGQRHLEDGMPADYRSSRASSEYQVSTHYHSLQHLQIGELQNGEGGSQRALSRTPVPLSFVSETSWLSASAVCR